MAALERAGPRVGEQRVRARIEIGGGVVEHVPEIVEQVGERALADRELVQRAGERLEPAHLDQRLAGEVHQAVDVLHGDADRPIDGGGTRRRGRRGGRRGGRGGRRRCGRGRRRRRRGSPQDRLEPRPQRRHLGVALAARDLQQGVGAAQEDVDVVGVDRHRAVERGEEAVLHQVRERDRAVDVDDPRRALDRVRRAHQLVQQIAVAGIGLEREEPLRQRGGVRLALLPEQVEQRRVGARQRRRDVRRRRARGRRRRRHLRAPGGDLREIVEHGGDRGLALGRPAIAAVLVEARGLADQRERGGERGEAGRVEHDPPRVAASRQASIAWPSSAAAPIPTMRAAPLIECAARASDSRVGRAAGGERAQAVVEHRRVARDLAAEHLEQRVRHQPTALRSAANSASPSR